MKIQCHISVIFRLIYKAILRVQLKRLFICNWQWLKTQNFAFQPENNIINKSKHVANMFFQLSFSYTFYNKGVLDSQLIYISLIIFKTTVISHL